MLSIGHSGAMTTFPQPAFANALATLLELFSRSQLRPDAAPSQALMKTNLALISMFLISLV
ncbi:MAG: hypothetical protein WBM27_03420 [bacterium]